MRKTLGKYSTLVTSDLILFLLFIYARPSLFFQMFSKTEVIKETKVFLISADFKCVRYTGVFVKSSYFIQF